MHNSCKYNTHFTISSSSKIPADFLCLPQCNPTVSVETATFGQHDKIQKKPGASQGLWLALHPGC